MINIHHKIAGIALSGLMILGLGLSLGLSLGISSTQAQNFQQVFQQNQLQAQAQNTPQSFLLNLSQQAPQNLIQSSGNDFSKNFTQNAAPGYAQNVGQCLTARATNIAQASGSILPLFEILRLASISRSANILSAPVCQINGQPYYLIKVLYPDGATREFTLRATDGSPYIAS